ncbi:MAG TPA: outer membrane protein transport protein [Steroidobacteraceae bacterium]|nr:outer membrane protein transport protein [Steroidobacteraceae bacterium]
MLLAPHGARAGGFVLLEQTASGVGDAYAGIAASEDDVSAMSFNPATLSLLTAPQAALGVHAIDLKADFSDRGSTLPPAGAGLLPRGSTSEDAGDVIPVPNAYFGMPLNDRLAFGFGLTAPFGLKTEYDDGWVGRFQGIRSKLYTVNANPALAFKVNDMVSLGVGASYQYANAELTNAVILGLGTEGRARLKVDDYAWSWNAGALFRLPSATRVGVSYRSYVDYHLSGDTKVTTLGGTQIPAVSGPTTAAIRFPNSAEISIAQPLGNGFELRADAMWMQWSTIDNIVATNSATGLPRDVLQFRFKNTMRYALGGTYKMNDQWTFRAGTAYDESPVQDEFRTVRLPDDDRVWATVGARWQPTPQWIFDAGYAHLFVHGSTISNARTQLGGAPAALFTSVVNGAYDSAVNIFSLQATFAFR